MNKKALALGLFLLVAGTVNVFAFGIGLQANANAGGVFAPGPALTFKTDNAPFVFALNWNLQDTVQHFGITADYWFLNKNIGHIGSAPINWFLGVGLFGNLTFIEEEDVQFSSGLRIPIGLNSFIGNGFFEPFVQIAPSFGLRFVPSLGTENMFFPMSIGFRLWFK